MRLTTRGNVSDTGILLPVGTMAGSVQRFVEALRIFIACANLDIQSVLYQMISNLRGKRR
jgi:hypothetical protein